MIVAVLPALAVNFAGFVAAFVIAVGAWLGRSIACWMAYQLLWLGVGFVWRLLFSSSTTEDQRG